VLAEFITEGHFIRHLRRMRNLYWERQQVLLKAAAAEFGGLLNLESADAGMHLTGMLPRNADDVEIAKLAAESGVETVALSSCYLGDNRASGLLLGYTGIRPPLIWRGARELGDVLKSSLHFA
jgi:GntR family transcriptional regulator/MocR family aminotransferase